MSGKQQNPGSDPSNDLQSTHLDHPNSPALLASDRPGGVGGGRLLSFPFIFLVCKVQMMYPVLPPEGSMY